MKRIVVFGGTTEGRRLSDQLASAEIMHTVCVATGYGSQMMTEGTYVRIRQGRMDAEEMRRFLEAEADIVVDATHPYAAEVTANIRSACEACGIRYLRIRRETGGSGSGRALDEKVIFYDTLSDLCEALSGTEGNILLTTGSRDIRRFAEDPGVRERLFVRVIPAVESLELLREAGIPGHRTIAMQGPFSEGLNKALMREYDIRVLVTKESGRVGGFEEKLRAAEACGVRVLVLANAERQTEGITISETLSLLGVSRRMTISLIGVGPGADELLGAGARRAIDEAEIVFGSRRMLERTGIVGGYPYFYSKDIIPILEEEVPRRAVVLFSGDTGFYSGAKSLRRDLERWQTEGNAGLEIRTYPGISSVSYLAARLGEAYDHAPVFSLHGRREQQNAYGRIVDAIDHCDRVFLLCQDRGDLETMGKLLMRAGMTDVRARVGCDLSDPEEEIFEANPEELSGSVTNGKRSVSGEEPGAGSAGRKDGSAESEPVACDTNGKRSVSWEEPGAESTEREDGCAEPKQGITGGKEPESLYTVLFCNPSPRLRPLSAALRDDDFVRGKIPMTKELVRHTAVMRLGLRENAVFYDVGCGTGSVSVEAAGLDAGIRVFAIDHNDEACCLTKVNAARHRRLNITVIRGEAPEAFEGLPAPSHVFIGGSTGRLSDICAAVAGKTGRVRIVITAISLETVSQICEFMDREAVTEVSVEQLSISSGRKAGAHTLMAAQNPVYVFAFTMEEE